MATDWPRSPTQRWVKLRAFATF
ncbi:hypothetical protein IL54_0773 [Sphingobium sp. ba1]|nr:hypothetical protein IL54_0773 [Sphingobium sp. ba1]